ncbi:MAG: family 78 glycoside hydrolase catalytic domain [bacterium]
MRVRLRAPAGTVVEVRYGNAETASGADHYTARGQGSEWFEPAFSLHAFRWVTLERWRVRLHGGCGAGPRDRARRGRQRPNRL